MEQVDWLEKRKEIDIQLARIYVQSERLKSQMTELQKRRDYVLSAKNNAEKLNIRQKIDVQLSEVYIKYDRLSRLAENLQKNKEMYVSNVCNVM